jgi:hypothetical protein
MEKHVLSFICLLLTLQLTNCRLHAQVLNQNHATAYISAEVVNSFSAVETQAMNFGSFSTGPDGGQIILSPQGTISVKGSVVRSSGTQNAASFYLTGGTRSAFSINLPDAPATLTSTSDSKTMLLRNWSYSPSTWTGAGTLQEGFETVFVGVTLEVGPMKDNPVGLYTGSYFITFDFN